MTKPLVIVTGGTRGIGMACVADQLAAGRDVHIIARTQADLARVRSSDPNHVTFSAIDLSNRQEVAEFFRSWDSPIWGLVNNAGVWSEQSIDAPDSDPDPWDEIVRTNLEGTYFLTKGLQSHIIDGGRIINLSSQLGTSGRAGFGAYAASKHAIIGLTRCWAIELGARRITVNVVAPGWVRTESNLADFRIWARERAVTAAAVEQDIADSLPLRRLIEPEEVAALVTFLLGDHATGITGQLLEVR